MASNNMTEPTAALISSVIVQNKSLRYLDLSSNRLGPVDKDFISKIKTSF
jgi:hypothetical protein